MKETVVVAGGGLAGDGASLQRRSRGYGVETYAVGPAAQTGAGSAGLLSELVCSNSLKSEAEETASGTLKAELDALGCRLLAAARECRVPSGSALAVDRENFSAAVERELHTAIHEMRNYIRDTYAGTAGLQEMMQQLEAQVMNIESLHLS